ncbi:MAG: hypothetical protein ACLR1K_00025 [Oscillospiraceae bacterium]
MADGGSYHHRSAGFKLLSPDRNLYPQFSKTKTFGASTFNGIDNYIRDVPVPEFWKATWNTILFCILTVPVGIILALLVALLLNAKVKFKGGFRAIYFLPMVCAPAAIAMVWQLDV